MKAQSKNLLIRTFQVLCLTFCMRSTSHHRCNLFQKDISCIRDECRMNLQSIFTVNMMVKNFDLDTVRQSEKNKNKTWM